MSQNLLKIRSILIFSGFLLMATAEGVIRCDIELV
ncbi:MAG: hypothetical protein PWQ81_557, partial [Bacteroidota bacterium]|nr:hypothetical protein [Bacteroidota bacterium]